MEDDKEHMKKIEELAETVSDDEAFLQAQNEQILITIEKYVSLIMLEFKEHLQKYNQIFTSTCNTTDDNMNMFKEIIVDFCNEVQTNQATLFEMISKLNAINNELPRLEEFYYKVREMRYGLEKMYKTYSMKIASS